MKKHFNNKFFSGFLAGLLAVSAAALPVYAADSTDTSNNTATVQDLDDADVIDYSKTGSLTIHKYDITAATAAGAYTQGERLANGQKDQTVEDTLADYAIQGVQFTYLRTGDIELYSNTAATGSGIEVVYEIPTALATILELAPADAYNMTAGTVAHKCTNTGVLHYSSTQISKALKNILTTDEIGAKNKLEQYLYSYGTQDSTTDGAVQNSAVNMPKTDATGKTSVDGLELGLYLIVETEVPEQVTATVNPWFASLPFTNITPQDESATGTEGGDYWLYDLVCYPKNQTGNPTLDKSVRNAYSSTTAMEDKNGSDAVASGETFSYNKADGTGALVVYNKDPKNAADTDNASYIANRGGYTVDGTTAGAGGAGYSYDFEYRDTTTASAADVLDYIIVSKLPHITSKSTYLSEYTFVDVLAKGMTYNNDAKIAFYDNATDANANNTKNAIVKWNLTDPESNFSQVYANVTVSGGATASQPTGKTQMTIKMLEEGLKVINGNQNTNNATHTKNNNVDVTGGLSDMYMVVYYTATVNSDSSLVLGDEGNDNAVVLTWSRTTDSLVNTLEDKNYVYSYSMDLTNEFSDGAGDMSKVEFKLYNVTDAYYVNATYNETDNAYYVTGKTIDKDAATTFVPKADSKFVVYGLEADSYAMTEIHTDNGYTLLSDSIIIEIEPTDREINASVAGVTGMDADAVNAIVQYYNGGIYDENGDLVTASKDYIANTNGNRPAVATANGRTIGKTDMYVGPIKAATATVDAVAATMAAQGASPDATVLLNVVNHANFELPQTGGMGTILFTLAGCGIAFVGFLAATRKKQET